MEVKLPDAAAREDILRAHLRRHTLQHSFGEGAVDQELLQVRLLAAACRTESAWHGIKPLAFRYVVLSVAHFFCNFKALQRLGSI